MSGVAETQRVREEKGEKEKQREAESVCGVGGGRERKVEVKGWEDGQQKGRECVTYEKVLSRARGGVGGRRNVGGLGGDREAEGGREKKKGEEAGRGAEER